VLFTTGRGTPFGTFVPTIKVATNNKLAMNKTGWMDFNAGLLAQGEAMPLVFSKFRELVLQTINGLPTKNEVNNYREMAIFKTGVTL